MAGDDKATKTGPNDLSAAKKTARGGRKTAPEGNVGNALRSVWQETVSEDIPGDMLDLLGKLS